MARRVLVLCVMAWLMPQSAAAGTVTFDIGYTALVNGWVLQGAGQTGEEVLDGGDTFVVPSGATWILDDELALTAGGNVSVANGGALIATVKSRGDDRDVIHINIDSGASGVTLNAATGSTVRLWGGYRQYGVAAPLTQTRLSTDNGTIWPGTDQFGFFQSTVPGTFGATRTSATRALLRLIFSDSRNNPNDGDTNGDMFLSEALSKIEAHGTGERDQLCFVDVDPDAGLVSPDSPFCYGITDVDATGPDYYIEIDILQRDGQWAAIGTEYDHSRRRIKDALLLEAGDGGTGVAPGDMCVDLEPGTGIHNTSGVRFDSRWLQLEADIAPQRIAYTMADYLCDGSALADHDSVHLLTPITTTAAASTEMVITPGAAVPGSSFYILTPIRFVDETAGEDDGKIVLAGTVDFRGVVFDGVKQIDLTGATVERWEDVHIRNCGDGGDPCLILNGIDFTATRFTMTDGDLGDGGADSISIEDISRVCLRDAGFRYWHDYAMATASGSSSGSFVGRRIVCQHVGDTAGNGGCFDDTEGAFSSIAIDQMECADALDDAGGCIAIDSLRTVARNVSIVGSDDGKIGIGANLEIDNLLVRRLWLRTSALPFLPPTVRNFDIRGILINATTGYFNPSASSLSNGIFHDVTTGHEDMFQGGAGEVFSNLLISDADSSDADCDTEEDCHLFYYDFDDDTDTVDVLENITIAHPSGGTTEFHSFVHHAADIDGESSVRMGGVFIADADGVQDANDVYGLDFDATAEVDKLDTTAGQFCFWGNSCTGCTWSDTVAAANASYDNMLRSGVRPAYTMRLDDVGLEAFTSSSLPIPVWGEPGVRCGIKEGRDAPGLRGYGANWMYARHGMESHGLVRHHSSQPDDVVMVVRAFGDSITASGGEAPDWDGWSAVHMDIRDEATAGRECSAVETDVDTFIATNMIANGEQMDIGIIFCGANDAGGNDMSTSAGEVEGAANALVAAGVMPLIVASPPMSDTADPPPSAQQIADLEELAGLLDALTTANGWHFANLWQTFTDYDNVSGQEMDELFPADDKAHPNQAGRALIGITIASALNGIQTPPAQRCP